MKQRLILVSFLAAAPLLGWGEAGHAIANEAATHGAPVEMPRFFHAAYPSLVYLGYQPDRWRGAGPSLEAVNPPDHFLDLEYVEALDLPPDRYKFIKLLHESGTLRRYGIEMTTSGFVPWRIAELCEALTTEWRLWRRAESGSPDRAQAEQDIIFLSGILGHFVADSSNPHHASINYNGWVLPNPNGYPNDCDTHNRFETQFVSRTIRLSDVLPHLAAPRLRNDYFLAALELIRESKSQIERLYTIDRDGGFNGAGSAEGRDFAARRLAVGSSVLRDLWWSAYRNSEGTRP